MHKRIGNILVTIAFLIGSFFGPRVSNIPRTFDQPIAKMREVLMPFFDPRASNIPWTLSQNPPAIIAVAERIREINIGPLIASIQQITQSPILPAESQALADFLSNLYREVSRILSDPRELARILAEQTVKESLVGAGAVGFAIGRFIVTKIRKDMKDPRILAAAEKYELVAKYLKRVQRSRLAEIVAGTNLSKEQVQGALRFGKECGCLLHEANCFWRFTDEQEAKAQVSKYLLRVSVGD